MRRKITDGGPDEGLQPARCGGRKYRTGLEVNQGGLHESLNQLWAGVHGDSRIKLTDTCQGGCHHGINDFGTFGADRECHYRSWYVDSGVYEAPAVQVPPALYRGEKIHEKGAANDNQGGIWVGIKDFRIERDQERLLPTPVDLLAWGQADAVESLVGPGNGSATQGEIVLEQPTRTRVNRCDWAGVWESHGQPASSMSAWSAIRVIGSRSACAVKVSSRAARVSPTIR